MRKVDVMSSADRVFADDGYCLKVITHADGILMTATADAFGLSAISVIAYC